MKQIKLFLGALIAMMAIACEGPTGPPGPAGFDGLDGIDGVDGVNILAQVLEIQGTFDAENEYSIFYEFPNDVEVFESDLVLAYILWEQVDDSNGGDPIDIWRALPQTRILDQGLLQYNFDHTFLDVSIFLESDFDLSTLLPGDTDDQVFRIAIVPGEFAQDTSIDLSNIDEVMKALDMDSTDIQKVPSF